MTHTATTATTATARAARIEEIRQAALVRRAGDRWCVWLHGRLVVDVGTIEEAIRLATRGGKAP